MTRDGIKIWGKKGKGIYGVSQGAHDLKKKNSTLQNEHVKIRGGLGGF